MKPEAIVFDIGNVLLEFDYLVAARRLIEKNRLAEPPDRETVIEIKNLYEAGKISRADFLSQVRPHFRDTGPEEEFVRIWADIFEPNTPMIEFVESVAGKIPLYLMSNIGCIHHEFIFDTYPFFQHFDDGIYSYQERLSKPDPAIYQRLITRFDLTPANTLYIDDLPANIDAGNHAGLQSILYNHKNHQAFQQALQTKTRQ